VHRYAYVTFIIRNDSFVPGALVFAFALRRQKTPHDIVCLVSKEVSEQARKTLELVYDDVIVISEIFLPHARRQERQDRPYLFTRFHAFRLGLDGDLGKRYEKIVLADADVLPLRDYDTLFDIDAPAGIINEKKEYCMTYENGKYIIPDSVYIDGTWGWHQRYQNYPHGSLIDKAITNRIEKEPDNMGVNASLYVLKPSMELYYSILEDMENPNIREKVKDYHWPEMQYLTLKLSGQWHNIDLRYSSFNGYPKIDVLYGTHFAGLKPWSIKNKSVKSFAKFEDYQLWFYVFDNMMQSIPQLSELGKLRRIHAFVIKLREEKQYQFQRFDIPGLDHLI